MKSRAVVRLSEVYQPSRTHRLFFSSYPISLSKFTRTMPREPVITLQSSPAAGIQVDDNRRDQPHKPRFSSVSQSHISGHTPTKIPDPSTVQDKPMLMGTLSAFINYDRHHNISQF